MSVLDFLFTLRELGINIELEDTQLKINAPKGKLTPFLINELKEKKTKIIDFLQTSAQGRIEYFPIKVTEKKEYYTLSSAQKRLYILQQLDQESTAYNIPTFINLESVPEIENLEKIFSRLLKRHQSFRTTFHMYKDEIVQKIHNVDNEEVKIAYYDVPGDLASLYASSSEFVRPFDMAEFPLWRVVVLKANGSNGFLLVDMHHIITDGISQDILRKEFLALYSNPDAELLPLKLQYKDFSEWQNTKDQRESMKRQQHYWSRQFSGEIPVLNLPLDYERPAQQSFAGDVITSSLSNRAGVLDQLVLTTQSTVFIFLLTLLNILFSKLSGQKDIIMGTPVSGRLHADLKHIIGMFVNTLALRNFPSGSKVFKQFLIEVKENTLRSFENQEYQFEDLVEQVEVRRDVSRNPLFDVMFSFQNIEPTRQQGSGTEQDPYRYIDRTSKFDIEITAREEEELIVINWTYCRKLYKAETIRKFIGYFENILSGIVEQPEIKISDIEIISEEERVRILYGFNNTAGKYPEEETVHSLFAQQAERLPENIALTSSDAQLTYRQLNEQTNQMAHFLRSGGVNRESRSVVAILAEPSFEMLFSVYGILKAGGVYLPIDPDYPLDRIEYMMKDSGAILLLTHERVALRRTGEYQVINIRHQVQPLSLKETAQTGENVKYSEQPMDLMYIMYTSGSTGKPKGVMVEQRSIVNLLFALQRLFPTHDSGVYLLKTSYVFDVSISELFGWFPGGGRLAILEPGGSGDPQKILDVIMMTGVTHINFIPGMFTAFVDFLIQQRENIAKLSTLNYIFLAGEALLSRHIHAFKSLNTRIELVNLYGPTEASVYSSCYSLNHPVDSTSIPIGRPLPNTTLYVMDENHHLQPPGGTGELLIGGAGLARGYLNNVTLTNEKFIHQDVSAKKKVILYRSGDLARWLNNGNIEFLGRMDRQVKIRGFRIELAEIENSLRNHKDVKDVIVTAGGDSLNAQYICAYIIPRGKLDQPVLKEHLEAELPYYMIPSFFVQIDHIPLLPSGKIDKKALPDPKAAIREGLTPPGNRLEDRLLEIWAEVLNIDRIKIGIDENFFQLGGHSLTATTLISKIHRQMKVKIPLSIVFKNPSIRRLAQYISTAGKNPYLSVKAVEKKEYYPGSSSQKRMYILNELSGIGTAYNMPITLKIEGKTSVELFQATFRQLIKRHETLRTSFEIRRGELVQRIHKDVEFVPGFSHFEASGDGGQIQDLIRDFIRPFDLREAPLLRATLIRLQEKEHIFLSDMHHIISDGVSLDILIKDFIALYNKGRLKALKIQYKDFSEWQKDFFESPDFKKQEQYWSETLGDGIPVLKMPLDYQRPLKQTFQGHTLSFSVSREETNQLIRVAVEQNLTLNILVLSLYALLISQYSGQKDFLIGSLASGRNRGELEYIIGMFGSFLPIRIKIPERENATFIGYLNEIGDSVVKAYENQDYPFERLIDLLEVPVDLSRNPIFDTLLNFHNEIDWTSENGKNIKELTFIPYEYENPISTLDFKLDAHINRSGELSCSLQYNTNLFKEETFERFSGHFNLLILKVLESGHNELSFFNVLTEREKQDFILKSEDIEPVSKPGEQIAVSATFTVDSIREHLVWWAGQFGLEPEVKFAPYNQVFQELLDETSLVSSNTGVNILLIRFEDWLRDQSLDEKNSCLKLEQNFEELLTLLRQSKRDIPTLVGIFPVSTHLSLTQTVRNYIEILNNRWLKAVTGSKNTYVLDFRELTGLYNIREIFDPVSDREGHLPFTDAFYAAMGVMTARKIWALYRNPFKVIALDCDNTLWKGICGEDGPTGVRVEGPYLELQRFMIQKYHQGILLVLCSKNNEADVWAVFEKNPDMVLKREHFVARRINWQPKSVNLKELSHELNLGIDSFIFIDDSPVEISEVMWNQPEVLALHLPHNSEAIPLFLRHVWAFDHLLVTEEDQTRSKMYLENKKRKLLEKESLSLKDFLTGLQLKVSMNIMIPSQLSRVSQLTQRTNQFNLSTIRRSETDISALTGDNKINCWVIEVSDRYGDYGLVGVLITMDKGSRLHIDTFLLSCRVLGRGVEETILVGLKKYCRECGLKIIEADYYPTAKNQPFLAFLQKKWREGQKHSQYTTYVLPVETIPQSPEYSQLFFRSRLKKESSGDAAVDVSANSSKKFLSLNPSTLGSDQSPGIHWKTNVVNRDKLLHRSHFLPIENHTAEMLLKLPLNIPEDNFPSEDSKYEEPRDSDDQKLEQLWQTILRIENPGINTSFFKLGGNSVKAISLVSKIHKEFNVSLRLRDIFENPTIKRLSDVIKQFEKTRFTAIERVEPKEYYALSSAQRRFYILQQMDLGSTAYNISIVMVLEGGLRTNRFEATVENVINRHESLRTSFELLDGKVWQKIHDPVDFKIEYFNLNEGSDHRNLESKNRAGRSQSQEKEIISDFIRPINLTQPPPFRMGLIRLSEKKHILMIDMHHIVSDGSSMSLLIRDFITLYSGKELPPLRLQYRDFCEWQYNLLTTGKMQEKKEYWLNHFSEKLPVLKLPTDFPRPSIQSFEGDSIDFHFDKELSQDMHTIIKESDSTLYMMLLALFNILLSKYSGQRDIIVGSPTAGRHHADLENIIGLLVETIAIRSHPEGDKTFLGFLKEVRENTLMAHENQAYPFGELLDQLAIENDRSRNPLFDTMLIVQNFERDIGNLRIEELKVSPYEGKLNKIAKVDLTLVVSQSEVDQEIYFEFEYCTRLFKRETVERLAESFRKIATCIVKNRNIKIKDIEISHDLSMASSEAYKGSTSKFEF